MANLNIYQRVNKVSVSKFRLRVLWKEEANAENQRGSSEAVLGECMFISFSIMKF